MSFWDFLILAVIAAGVFFAVRSRMKKRKDGACGCGAGCTGCSLRSACHASDQCGRSVEESGRDPHRK